MSEFKRIEGVDDPAEIDRDGRLRLRSLDINGKTFKNVPLKPSSRLASGFVYIMLRSGGKPRPFYIHRLVAELFVDNPRGYSFVKFIDGNKFNFSAKNLEWIKSPPRKKTGNKIGPREASAIRKAITRGERNIDIARKYEVSPALVSKIKSGERWS
jgi:hypothetical protein